MFVAILTERIIINSFRLLLTFKKTFENRLTSEGAGDPSLVAVDAEGLIAAAAALAALISSIVSGLTILSALLRGLLT